MPESKIAFCSGTPEDLCKGSSCKFEETDKGFTITVTSDDPKMVEQLKTMMKSCCNSGDNKSRR